MLRRVVPCAAWLMVGGCEAYDRGLYETLTHDGSASDVQLPTCDNGLPLCGTECVDLLNDPRDCGRCGRACTGSQTCQSGTCTADAGTMIDAAMDGDAVQPDVPMDTPLDRMQPDVPAVDVPRDVPMDVPRDVPVDVPPTITPPVFRAVTSATLPAGSGCCLTLARPASSVTGDLLLAAVALGVSGASSVPTMTTPSGWTLLRRIDHTTVVSLWIFWKFATSTEPSSYLFSTNRSTLGGAGYLAAYSHVNATSPIDAEASLDMPASQTLYSTPTVTTVHPQALLIATFSGHGGTANTWATPSGMTERVDVNDTTTRSIMNAETVHPSPGTAGPFASTASIRQDFAVTDLLALRPAGT